MASTFTHETCTLACSTKKETRFWIETGPQISDVFLKAIAPFREKLAIAAECIFTWFWLADLCAREGIDFVLGHALYMKAIHGGKAKNDRIDALKIGARSKCFS